MKLTEPENTQEQTKGPWPEMLLEIPVMAGNRLRQQVSLLSPCAKRLLLPEALRSTACF